VVDLPVNCSYIHTSYCNLQFYVLTSIPWWAYLQGIWGGMIGGTVMQTAILLWVTIRTDWKKEVPATKPI
jgi:MATE family multidrug resistance protein